MTTPPHTPPPHPPPPPLEHCCSCALRHLNPKERDQEGDARPGSSHRGNPKIEGGESAQAGPRDVGPHRSQSITEAGGRTRVSAGKTLWAWCEGRTLRSSELKGHGDGGSLCTERCSQETPRHRPGLSQAGGPPSSGDDGLCLPEEALGSQPSCPFSLVHPLGTMPRSVQETGPCASDE